MEHILKQTELPHPIYDVGCAFDTLIEKAQRLSAHILSRKECEMLWLESIREGYIDKDTYEFYYSAPITNLAFIACDSTKRSYEIGTFSNGIMTWYGLGNDKKNRKNLEYMQKIKADNPVETHFRGVDYRGRVTWEPWSSPVECLGIYHSVVYTII